MNRLLLSFLMLIFVSLTCFSQNNVEKLNDEQRISIVAWVPQQIEGMPSAARASLQNKLTQIITQNGFGATALDNRFILTANIAVTTKDVTATTPPMQAYTLEVTFYIGDGYDGTLFSSTSLNLKGVGETEQKAYMAALKGLKPNDQRLNDFIAKGKQKIIEYYNSNCDFILREAQSLVDQNQLEAAIAKLVSVPNVCADCFAKANEAIKPLYQKYIERDCTIKLQEAKAIWNAAQDLEAANRVIPIIASIDPDAKCYSQVKEFMGTVSKRVKELDDREWNTLQTQLTREYNLEKQSIDAARAIGVAYGNNQPNVEYKLLWW